MSSHLNGDGLPAQLLIEKVVRVGAPSGAHNIRCITELATDVSSHGYGFSFYDPDSMTKDTERINQFLAAARKLPVGAEGKLSSEAIAKLEDEHGIKIYSVSTSWNTMANPFGRGTY